MKNLTILAIDDDSRRLPIYQKFIDAYNSLEGRIRSLTLVFCGTIADAEREVRARREPFIVLLDMVLANWNSEQCRNLEETLSGMKTGIMAVSSRFNEPDATSTYVNFVRRLRARYLPIVHWSSVQVVAETVAKQDGEASIGAARTTLDQFDVDLRTLLGWDILYAREPNEDVLLLHLSDLHFGLDAPSRNQHLFQIGARLRQLNKKVDFVCVSGDSNNKGHVIGYDPAAEWIRGLAQNNCFAVEPGSGIQLEDRILICPGNHDFNEGLAISAYAKRSAQEDPGYEFIPAKDATAQPRKGTWMYGLAPFLKYHESLTGWRVGHGEFPGYRVVSTYSSLGLHFVEFWGEKYQCGKYPSPLTLDWFKDTLAEMAKDVDRAVSDGDCLIFLVHRFSPTDTEDVYREIRKMLGSLADRIKVIVLSGHFHEDVVTPVPGHLGVLSIQGGTIEESMTADDQLAKIGLLTLRRQAGRVVEAQVEWIQSTAKGWSLDPEKTIYRCGTGKKWIASDLEAPGA